MQTLKRPPWRTVVPGGILLLAVSGGYLLWNPGLDVRDGRHDRGRNGIWISHGWPGGDEWFIKNGKTNDLPRFRDPKRIAELADRLRRHHITDVFPHLCPAEPDGELPPVDSAQVERFLGAFDGFRVIPWIGGPSGSSVRLPIPKWRETFAGKVRRLIEQHPRLAGVQVNVEPLTTGDTNFLTLLEGIRAALPPSKVLSVAAYPPPTRWQPSEDVHWSEAYFREVARRCDQMAVMMYDVGQRMPKAYQHVMAGWTREALAWSESKSVLLGVPTYNDPGVDYHNSNTESLTNALLGIHRGLASEPMATNYQGVSIYCDWETTESEWAYFREHFLSTRAQP